MPLGTAKRSDCYVSSATIGIAAGEGIIVLSRTLKRVGSVAGFLRYSR